MKHLKYFQFAAIITLMVTAVSCTVARGGYYEEDPYNNSSRYYGTSPYYGNGGNYIILERNPYTGEYYPANGVSTYPSRIYNNRSYSNNTYRNYDRRDDKADHRNDREVNNRYRNNSVDYSQQRQQQEQQRQENVNRMRSSKESVLGKKKD